MYITNKMISTKNRKKSKAQVSFEFLLVVGFGFAVLIPSLLFFLSYSNSVTDDIVEKQAQDIGFTIKKNIEIAQLYGAGSLIEIEVNVPEELNNITIIPGLTSADPSTINFNLNLVRGEVDLPVFVTANISGGLNKTCIAYGKRVYYVVNNGSNILIGCKLEGTMQNDIDTIYDKLKYKPSYTCRNGKVEKPFEECDDNNNVDGGVGDYCNNQCFNQTGLRLHLP